MVMEKTTEWGMPCLLGSLDLSKAFDYLKWQPLMAYIETLNIPIRLKYAMMRELFVVRVAMVNVYGLSCDSFQIFRGSHPRLPWSLFCFFLHN